MYAWITATKPLAKSSLTLRVVAKNHYSSPSVLRKLGFKIIMMDDGDFGQKNKKIMMTAHAQPQEMSPDKTLRSGRRRAGQEARNQKRHRKVRRIPAGSKLWSTRAQMFRLKNLCENKKFWMGVFRT